MADRKSIGLIGWLIAIITIVSALALLLSYASLYISPTQIWPIPFFGIAYPYLALLNFILFSYWLIHWRKFAIYSLLALLVGGGLFQRYYGLDKDQESFEDSIQLLSYNVHVFGRWQVGADWQTKSSFKDSIVDFVHDQEADIINFQEYYISKKEEKKGIQKMGKKLNLKYHSKISYTPNRKGTYICTFSKYPIVSSGYLDLGEKAKRFCLYSDIQLDNEKIVRVYNIHLSSLNINSEEYLFSGEIDLTKQQNAKKIADGTKNIIKNMRRAFANRAQQVDTIRHHIAQSPYPAIIMGDFNDTPVSYAYSQLKEGNKDAFVESGEGFSETYVGKFPSFRIDFILHDEKMKSSHYKRSKVTFSDHHPIKCRVSTDWDS